MNTALTEQIVKHIFSNFKVIPSTFVDSKSISLKDKFFLLKEKLNFEVENQNISNNIWGCQFNIENQEMNILLGDCKVSDIEELCLVVKMSNLPTYGLYLSQMDESNSLIGFSLDGKEWNLCGTYLQATFLAGMERLKEIGLLVDKCSNYQDLYKSMLAFLAFYEENV